MENDELVRDVVKSQERISSACDVRLRKFEMNFKMLQRHNFVALSLSAQQIVTHFPSCVKPITVNKELLNYST
jgi:hypothetical protein